ncbi:hypothetical protein C8R44DRAFT_862078 [Mycena epipterygia]|nr:hypothetical protein C8R44DRAFT_862078 [Mycena epipterygia]
MSTPSRHTWSTCVEAYLVHTSEVKMTVNSVVGGPKFKAASELGTERMYDLDLILPWPGAAAQPVIRAGRNAVGAGKVLNKKRLACIETADCALFSGPSCNSVPPIVPLIPPIPGSRPDSDTHILCFLLRLAALRYAPFPSHSAPLPSLPCIRTRRPTPPLGWVTHPLLHAHTPRAASCPPPPTQAQGLGPHSMLLSLQEAVVLAKYEYDTPNGVSYPYPYYIQPEGPYRIYIISQAAARPLRGLASPSVGCDIQLWRLMLRIISA